MPPPIRAAPRGSSSSWRAARFEKSANANRCNSTIPRWRAARPYRQAVHSNGRGRNSDHCRPARKYKSVTASGRYRILGDGIPGRTSASSCGEKHPYISRWRAAAAQTDLRLILCGPAGDRRLQHDRELERTGAQPDGASARARQRPASHAGTCAGCDFEAKTAAKNRARSQSDALTGFGSNRERRAWPGADRNCSANRERKRRSHPRR